MTEALPMSARKMSEATAASISSPELPGGTSPSDLPDGPTTDLFGQEAAPASPSQPLAKAKHQAMNAICGPNGSGLSAQFDRQQSLVNRLKRLLDGAGSTLFTLTWKRKATPLGRPYYQLAASARRISGSDCGSWPTPMVGNTAGCMESPHGYVSPTGNRRGHQGNHMLRLARLASWPTPTVHDAERGGQEKRAQGETRHGSNLQDFALTAAWATPRTSDAKGGQRLMTPDGKRTNKAGDKEYGPNLQDQAALIGPTSSGSPAQTASKGQLNPAFSLWLMGFPPEWLSCAPQATRSTRGKPSRSSKRQCEGMDR
jgi:hypothetical protein